MARLTSDGARLAEQLVARRKALGRLRFILNHQAAAKLDGLIREAADRPRHPGKHAPAAGKGGGGGGGREGSEPGAEVGAGAEAAQAA
jgi:hypothetical protein